MNTRYIQRFRLPERQYTAGCPVVLAAGALLEDTKLPRLVAQLKLKSISAKPIAAVTITLCCLDGNSTDAGVVPFSYQSLTIGRGQAFGQYTAIVLPGDSIRSLAVTVNTATFCDGTIWTAPEGATWDSLPGFTPLEHAGGDPTLQALSRRALPKGKYAYTASADLWYCTCGGVNHSAEATCHRCNTQRSLVAQYTRPGPLADLHQAQREEAARRETEQEQARQEALAAAAQRKAQRKRRLEAEPLPEGGAAVKPKRLGKKTIFAAAAGLAAVAAVAVLLPKFAGEPPVPSSASPSPIVETPSLNGSAATPNPDDDIAPEAIHVTTPGDLGETVFMDIQVGPDGQCTVDMDMIKAQFPEVMFFSGSGSPLGNDIDDYLMDSYHMAVLVSNGTRQPGYDRNHVSAQNFCAILLYDDQAHLYGYAIGLPKDRGGGVCRLEFTRCDYDFSSLVQEQAGAYSDSVETLEQMRHVSPGEIYDCGAAWYIRGFNTTKDSGRDRVCQMYHLWSCLNSPYLERHCRNMKYFQPPQENANDLRYTYYLLLDEDYDLIGYTLLSSEDAAPTESDAPQATSRYVTAPGDKETVYIDLELGTNGECRITLAELQAQFPQAEYMEFNGVPRMGLSIDDYLLDSFQMAFLVGSHGQSGGDDDAGSFSPTTDPDSTRALLLFDSKTHLMGHAIGVPEEMGDGTWRLYLTLCDYDFAPLLEEQMTAYYASEQMSYIPPEEIDSCGADWFLYAYHMRADREMLGHCQMYHLWSQLNSPYLERHCREIETLESRRPRGDAQNPRYVYYLLLDQDHELIGYTMLTSGSSTAPPAV